MDARTLPGLTAQTSAPALPADAAAGDQATNAAAAAAGGSSAALRALADGPQRIVPAQITGTDAERLRAVPQRVSGARVS
ncbi:hypothetical protein ACFWR4_13195 [Streptomyces hydrogenans]|uniref:hypothetical protein n=1 Tax=Streptomyces hydrogenans TaxID=1873719 RepID=UPI00365A6EEE